jgi:hypothetical protein
MKPVRGLSWVKERRPLKTVPHGPWGWHLIHAPVYKSLPQRTPAQLLEPLRPWRLRPTDHLTGFYLNSPRTYVYTLMNKNTQSNSIWRGVNGLNSGQTQLDKMLAGRFIFAEEKFEIAIFWVPMPCSPACFRETSCLLLQDRFSFTKKMEAASSPETTNQKILQSRSCRSACKAAGGTEVAIEGLERLCHILEVQNSNLGPEIWYPEWGF